MEIVNVPEDRFDRLEAKVDSLLEKFEVVIRLEERDRNREDRLHGLELQVVQLHEGLIAVEMQANTNSYVTSGVERLGWVVVSAVVGAKKYKAWNWAKGMAWSVPTGCILRHAKAIIEDAEELDPESGLPHIDHIVCNVMMLAWYVDQYPEGDDRPPMREK